MNIVWISKISMDMPHKTSRLKLSESLIKRGHNVTLFVVKKFGEKNCDSKYIRCISTIDYPILSGFFYGLLIFFYFPILLKRIKIDIIIIDCTKVWLPFVIPLKILNKPIVLDIRTLPIEKEKPFFFKTSIFLSKYIVDGITTITPELYNELKNKYNLKEKKICFWPSGVSIEDFDRLDKKSDLKINFKDCDLILAYHGTYDSKTRKIENIIIAISELDPSLKNRVGLLIIGMPPKKIKDLLKLCEELGIRKNINIIPKVEYNKIPQFLQIADIGVIPLPPEHIWWRVSAPLKTLEYLAAKKPIIATSIPFHCKIFKKAICGILLDSSSPKAIAYGITYLFTKQKDLKRMGEEGRKIVEKYYTWDVIAQKVEDFLKNISN